MRLCFEASFKASLAAPCLPFLTFVPTVRPPPSWVSANPASGRNDPRSRRVRQLPASFTPLRLHPVDIAPEGVPSSLFTFRPGRPRSIRREEFGEGAMENRNDDAGVYVGAATLQAGLVEEKDLPGVSGLLVEAFPQGFILAEGEFSKLEQVVFGAPLEMTNKYLNAVAYYEVFYALKTRCGDRLIRGDFNLSSDAVVLAVRNAANAKESDGRDIVAVVELDIRQPDGRVPSNWPFRAPWQPKEPKAPWQPYMCNLAVAEEYRGQGFGKQLVRLCEHVAKNHWGYESIYLHVDLNDSAATGLYNSMGYESMEQYDAPMWMRKLFGMPTIRYQVKRFKSRRGSLPTEAS